MRKLHYFISRWFITLMLSFAAMPVFAGGAVPVMVGGVAKLDACGGLGEVRGLNQSGDGFLAVRMGPGRKYPMIDRLYNGNQVYFCDSHGEWIGIVYGKPAAGLRRKFAFAQATALQRALSVGVGASKLAGLDRRLAQVSGMYSSPPHRWYKGLILMPEWSIKPAQ